MRHRKKGNRLGRGVAHRKAMTRNMVTSLFEHGRVQTTLTKAKGVRPVAEKLITLAKRGDLHARRQAARWIQSPRVLQDLFDHWAREFASREGGYTRVLKGGFRHGDGAEIAYLELVGADGGTAPPPRDDAGGEDD